MAQVYISIGSNIGPARRIREGVAALREAFGFVLLSPVYESRAVGFEGDNFYNLVAGLDIGMPVAEINALLHDIEDRFGRERSGPRFSSRTLDLDLLLYDDLVGEHGGVTLPREEITHHAHVLFPLADLAADLVHPVTGKSLAQMRDELETGDQDLWVIDFDWTDDDYASDSAGC